MESVKNNIQCTETRCNTVFRHTRAMLRESGQSFEKFAVRVVEEYERLTPAGQRSVQFKRSGDVFADAIANAQKLRRWMDESINARMPSEIEEAWVAALPEPHHGACVWDLCMRYSRLPVPLPREGADLVAFGDVLKESGEAFQASAPIMADGKISTGTTPDLIAAVREHQEAASHHLSWAAALQRELDNRREKGASAVRSVRAVK